MVEQTVLEPVMVTETRKIQVTEYKQEQKTREITVCKLVPRTEMRTRTVAYTENETRTREEQYTECKTVSETVQQSYTVMVPYCETRKGTRCVLTPVTKEVQQTYTVNVPYTEQRTGTRTEWECIPVVQTRTVCEDQGHWEQRCVPVSNGCQSCGVVTHCCRPRRHHACCGADPCG